LEPYRTIGDASIGSASAVSPGARAAGGGEDTEPGFAFVFSINTILVFGEPSNIPIPATQKAPRDASKVTQNPNAPIPPVLSSWSERLLSMPTNEMGLVPVPLSVRQTLLG
jgi:hypothetical protein